jgi:hypothetical protein
MAETRCRNGHKLSLLLDGRLPADEAARLREHLTHCGACRAEWDDLGRLSSALSTLLSPEPSPSALPRLHAALARGRTTAQRRLVWAATACALLAGVALALWHATAPAPGPQTVANARPALPAATPTATLDRASEPVLQPPPARPDARPATGHARRSLTVHRPNPRPAGPRAVTPKPETVAQRPPGAIAVAVAWPEPQHAQETEIEVSGGSADRPDVLLAFARSVDPNSGAERIQIVCRGSSDGAPATETDKATKAEEEIDDGPKIDEGPSDAGAGGSGGALGRAAGDSAV